MQTSFCVTTCSRTEVWRAVVAVEVDEWVTQREGLGHTYQCVVNGAVTVWVIARHGVAGNARALHKWAVGTKALLVHVPNNAAVNWL